MHALTHTPTTTTPTIAQTPLSLSVSLQHRPIVEEDGHDSDSDWTPHIRNKDAKGHVIPTTPKLLFLNTNDKDDASNDDDSDDNTSNDDNHKDEDTIYGDDYTTHGGDYKMCHKINKNDYNGDDDEDNYYNNINNSRDEESTLDLTLGSKINMSDAELMDGRNASPGALRLTEEGLVEHTEKQQRYYDTNNITGSTTYRHPTRYWWDTTFGRNNKRNGNTIVISYNNGMINSRHKLQHGHKPGMRRNNSNERYYRVFGPNHWHQHSIR
jgi:hypothetical protein